MIRRSRMVQLTFVSAAIAALVGTTVSTTASAAGDYNTTVAGFNNMTPLVALATSSMQPVVTTNLPANVGIYALHCAVPANPRSAPTLCDSSVGSATYIPATAAARDSVNATIKLNGEFYGTNPNPQSGATAPASVDCRATTAPGTTACAVYILGAGRESSNPQYMRVFPTVFSPVKANRADDSVKVTPKAGSTLASTPAAFKAITKSGLKPTITATGCALSENDTKIQATATTGTCEILITTTGGKNFKPLVQKLTYEIG